MARVFTNLTCVETDERLTRVPMRVFLCPFMCCFGGDRVFIAYEDQLWRLRPYTDLGNDFFSKLVQPNLYLYVEEDTYRKDGGYMFICQVNDGENDWIDQEDDTINIEALIVYESLLENVHHALVRVQRWVRRMLQRERLRPVLLRAVTAQNCAFGGLGRDIIEGVILKMACRPRS
jgi:hypothetical protein